MMPGYDDPNPEEIRPMGALADKTVRAPEDLLAMPDEKSYELIDGELVERNMGVLSSWVGGRLYRRLDEFVEDQKLGWVFPADAGFQCFPGSPRTVRKTDVSFIRSGASRTSSFLMATRASRPILRSRSSRRMTWCTRLTRRSKPTSRPVFPSSGS